MCLDYSSIFSHSKTPQIKTMVFRSGPFAPGVAFITGGARGIGNAIGVSFAKEGARGVVLVDIQDEATFEEGKQNVEKYGAKVKSVQIPP